MVSIRPPSVPKKYLREGHGDCERLSNAKIRWPSCSVRVGVGSVLSDAQFKVSILSYLLILTFSWRHTIASSNDYSRT